LKTTGLDNVFLLISGIDKFEKKTPKLSHPLNVKLLFLNNPSEQDGNTYTSTTARSENFSIPYLKFQIQYFAYM
jgi:hypothetical protein